ncbi:MAG: hypothetical protein R3C41_07035 [Calditrichia bacterium]
MLPIFGARDLAHNDAGDIFVAGNNGATDEPRVYVKYADSTHWEMLPTATLPGIGRVPAITVGETPDGNQTPFIAVDSNIYYLDVNTWKLGFSYPIGMDINVLFFRMICWLAPALVYTVTFSTAQPGSMIKEILLLPTHFI